jgi:type VI secretion system secreted protein Hcp
VKRFHLILFLAVFTILIDSGSVHAEQVTAFLKLDGISGDSTTLPHRGEIELLSYFWSESMSASVTAGSRAGAGKINMQDVMVTMFSSTATPKLFVTAASGTHIRNATITLSRVNTSGIQDLVTWKLSDVMISSYKTFFEKGKDARSRDELTLNFSKIEVEYKPTGSKAGWDLKTQKATN